MFTLKNKIQNISDLLDPNVHIWIKLKWQKYLTFKEILTLSLIAQINLRQKKIK